MYREPIGLQISRCYFYEVVQPPPASCNSKTNNGWMAFESCKMCSLLFHRRCSEAVVFSPGSLLSWLGTSGTSLHWVISSRARWRRKSCKWPARSSVRLRVCFLKHWASGRLCKGSSALIGSRCTTVTVWRATSTKDASTDFQSITFLLYATPQLTPSTMSGWICRSKRNILNIFISTMVYYVILYYNMLTDHLNSVFITWFPPPYETKATKYPCSSSLLQVDVSGCVAGCSAPSPCSRSSPPVCLVLGTVDCCRVSFFIQKVATSGNNDWKCCDSCYSRTLSGVPLGPASLQQGWWKWIQCFAL